MRENFSPTEELRQRTWGATEDLGYVAYSIAPSLCLDNRRIVSIFASPQTHVAEGINEGLIEGNARIGDHF